MAFSIPVMAATLAFVTYTSTAHNFDVAVIFSSFSLFQLLRQPLMFLPRALSAISDAQSAITRLEKVFHSELIAGDTLIVDHDLDVALRVEHASFEWEESVSQEMIGASKKKENTKKAKEFEEKLKALEDDKKVEKLPPFKFRDVDFAVPRGQLVGFVGPVGSGKVFCFSNLFASSLIVCLSATVKSSARPHWRDASHGRESYLRWTGRVLPADSLDPECNTGIYHSVGRFLIVMLIQIYCSATTSYSDKRSTKTAIGMPLIEHVFSQIWPSFLTATLLK